MKVGSRVTVCAHAWPALGGRAGTIIARGSTPFVRAEVIFRVRLDEVPQFKHYLYNPLQQRRPMRFGPFDEPAMGLDERVGDADMDFRPRELRPISAVDALGDLAR
jgi:hypothetical protein